MASIVFMSVGIPMLAAGQDFCGQSGALETRTSAAT